MSDSALAERTEARLATGVLSEHARIAFLPPSTCRDLGIAPSTATAEQIVLQNDCGVAMAELEREAAKSGFTVVSWQALRPPVTGTTFELAKALSLDAIIEVDQLSFTSLTPNSSSALTVSLLDEVGQPLVVDDIEAVAGRCNRNYPSSGSKVGAAIGSASLSAKLVTASDATVLWLFRRTLPGSRSLSATDERSFTISAGAGGWVAMGVVGVLAAAVGAMTLYLGRNESTGVSAGVPLMAGGGTLGVLGFSIAVGSSRGETGLCLPANEREVPSAEPHQSEPRKGSTITLTSSSTAQDDGSTEQRRRLMRTIAADLVSSLRTSHGLPTAAQHE